MPLWTPEPQWKGQDACIIGGGASLVGYDFQQLEGRNTIGCNDAFRLGSKVAKICLFGDASFFHKNKWDLEKYDGTVVTCASALLHLKLAWLKQMARVRDGLHIGSTLGWNYSTGAAAVNLAITLGATRIFLLGFDMGKTANKSHWHNQPRNVKDESYLRFIRGFLSVQKALPNFPGVKVFNVTDGSSKLPYFTRIAVPTFRAYVPPQNRVECVECKQTRERLAKELVHP